MPLDAICLRAVLHELRPQLIGARIDKVQQPARDQIVLLLRGNLRLLLNAGANQPRIQLTNILRDNPAQPPMFCMLLRKHLAGGRIITLRQEPLERVVTLPEEQASYLKSQGAVTLRFAKGFDQNIRMQVVSVSAPEDGQAAVTLSCRKYLAQTTLLRHQAADVILRTYEGLRVPSNALRVSEEGVTGVYCVDGSTAAFRPVTVLYQGQGYALVQPAEGASDTQTLRVGDEVIATAGALSDGKVIR